MKSRSISSGDSIGYKNIFGRVDFLKIESQVLLFRGGLGDIFEVLTEKRGKRKKYVIKKYKGDTEEKKQERAVRAFKNYRLAKAAGLKVFPTFRISEDERSLVMTNANTLFTCVSSNFIDSTLEHFRKPKLANISDVDKLIEEIFAQAEKASKNYLSLDRDAYFYLVPHKEEKPIEIVIGDMDHLEELSEKDPEAIKAENFEEARLSLMDFFNNNVENPDQYHRMVEANLKAL